MVDNSNFKMHWHSIILKQKCNQLAAKGQSSLSLANLDAKTEKLLT